MNKKSNKEYVTWGTSLVTPAQPHGIVIVNTTLFLIWVAGKAGAWKINTFHVAGEASNTNFSCDANTGIVTITRDAESAMTYIGR